MKVLCTHPGRYGDLLWALPTVRQIAVQTGEAVDLLLPPRYASEGFLALLLGQPYLGHVYRAADWEVRETAPMTPRVPPTLPTGYDLTVHLGYEDWPLRALPYEIARLAQQQLPDLEDPDLDEPWITVPYVIHTPAAVGFTDEHFELKYGLYWLLRHALGDKLVNISNSPRWNGSTTIPAFDWRAAASWVGHARVVIADCSALHVLAVACGTPVVVVEPNPARHHDCFYPFGTLGPRVKLLTGNDGQPTVDSRHLLDHVQTYLEESVAPEAVQ